MRLERPRLCLPVPTLVPTCLSNSQGGHALPACTYLPMDILKQGGVGRGARQVQQGHIHLSVTGRHHLDQMSSGGCAGVSSVHVVGAGVSSVGCGGGRRE